MAAYTRVFHVADCDTCGSKLKDADDNTMVAINAEQIIDDAHHIGWATYHGKLTCNSCVIELAGAPHDFVTHRHCQPFCAICSDVPDAGHTNLPQPGQLEIPTEQVTPA